MRCPRCGNENQDGMRFCGMCGGTLLASPPPAAARPGQGASHSQVVSEPATATATRPSAPEAPRTPPHRSEDSSSDSSSISGPSFLGLNDPAPPRKRANLSIDPHSGSRNLDYLLEDEEQHHGGGGLGKFFLIVLALALAVGFGYLRWKDQLPPWLTAIGKKPAPTAQTQDQPATPAESQTAPSPSITPEPEPATNQPATNQPAPNPPVANPPAQTPPAAQPPPDSSAADSSRAKRDSEKSAESTPTATTPPAGTSTANDKASEPATKSPTTKSDDTSDESESAAAPAAPAHRPKPAAQPAPKPRAATKPVDSVVEAQKYLYGRGAAQDCDHGLRILKPLANQGNAKAMVEMGALYSAGLCTPHDLPTAYRWFAVALRKDPSNEAIQTDLQKLWGEMTQPERQLAIKLTQ